MSTPSVSRCWASRVMRPKFLLRHLTDSRGRAARDLGTEGLLLPFLSDPSLWPLEDLGVLFLQEAEPGSRPQRVTGRLAMPQLPLATWNRAPESLGAFWLLHSVIP